LNRTITFAESESTRGRLGSPGLLSQSGRGSSLEDARFPSLDLLCGTVYRLNFGSSTADVHFADDWSPIYFN